MVVWSATQAATVSNLVKQIWLYRYARQMIIKYDHANEFLCHTFKTTQSKKIQDQSQGCNYKKSPRKLNASKNLPSQSKTCTCM